MMTPEEMQAVAAAVVEHLDERRQISEQDHSAQHQWVQLQMARERRRQEMWSRVKSSVLGWLIIGVLGGVGAAVWLWAVQAVQRAN